MNLSTAVFLVNDECRAVMATYEADTKERPAPRTMFKTFDPSIAVGDLVIVPTNTRHSMTVVKVVEADVEVDFDDATKVDWVIAKIDPAAHERLVAQERQLLDKIQSAQNRKRRQELAAAMMADAEDEIKALPIAGSSSTATS